jgi:hypothetical protein
MQRRLQPLLALTASLLAACGSGSETAASSQAPPDSAGGKEDASGPPAASMTASGPMAPAALPPTGNLPPVFESSGSGVLQDADPRLTFYAAVATDPEGAAITFRISGGPDAGSFVIDPGYGELRFLAPPDPERPSDADGNNIYVLTISASDGVSQTEQETKITVNRDLGQRS